MPPNGSATSSKPVTSRPATLTSDRSETFEPTTSAATPNAISSLALADGPLPSDSPAGQTADLFGLAPAPASPSPRLGQARQPMTNAICGLRGFLSSPSAALQSSLESKLKRRLDGAGSTLFSLTWKAKATPAGRPYFQLVASVRPISVNDCGSWPTPTANENSGDLTKKAERRDRMAEKWKGVSGNGFGHSMAEIALGSWPTPMAGTPAQKGYNEAGNNDSSRKMVELASWPTATAHDADRGGQAKRAAGETRHGSNLQDFALLTSWVTPRAEDSESCGARWGRGKHDTLTAQARLTASGETPNGSPAQMGKPGQLHPELPRWAMGYQTAHLNCAPTETPSFLRSQRSSFVPRSDTH